MKNLDVVAGSKAQDIGEFGRADAHYNLVIVLSFIKLRKIIVINKFL